MVACKYTGLYIVRYQRVGKKLGKIIITHSFDTRLERMPLASTGLYTGIKKERETGLVILLYCLYH